MFEEEENNNTVSIQDILSTCNQELLLVSKLSSSTSIKTCTYSKGYISQDAKRLLLYAPDEPDWNIVSKNWDKVLHFPSKAGDGLSELEYNQIIDTITNMI